jgi:hypothetical protein
VVIGLDCDPTVTVTTALEIGVLVSLSTRWPPIARGSLYCAAVAPVYVSVVPCVVTVTVAVSSVHVSSSQTRNRAVNDPGSGYACDAVAVALAAVSNVPSLSKSHRNVNASAGTSEPDPVNDTATPHGFEYGPPASAVGAWFVTTTVVVALAAPPSSSSVLTPTTYEPSCGNEHECELAAAKAVNVPSFSQSNAYVNVSAP